MSDFHEKRRHRRFGTEADIYFQVTYDVNTKVEFQVVGEDEKTKSEKYPATGKNVSAQGLCFVSEKQLDRGDKLYLEVYLPGIKDPVKMHGEVAWSHPLPSSPHDSSTFGTGVKLGDVDGKPVEETIHYDEEYKVTWSSVLESVLGNFRTFMQKTHKR